MVTFLRKEEEFHHDTLLVQLLTLSREIEYIYKTIEWNYALRMDALFIFRIKYTDGH